MAKQPRVKTHYARNGDVLYEVEIDLGEGRRGLFKWRQPWPRPELIGLFEQPKAGELGIEKLIPYGQRGAFVKQRERAHAAVRRESLQHPWRRYLGQASPCTVHLHGVRCLSERHTLPLPAELKATKDRRARKGPKAKRRP